MTRIHILSPGFLTPNGSAFLFPLIVWRRKLQDAGVDIRLFQRVTDEFVDADILVVENKFYGKLFEYDLQRVLEEIRYFSGTGAKVIYVDTTDSAHIANPDLLPLVDIYCKNQLLRDRQQYLKPHYGLRLFTDYYHTTNAVEDLDPLWSKPVPSTGLLDKLQIGWNSGLADYRLLGPQRMKLFHRIDAVRLLTFPRRFLSPQINRPIALHSRFGITYKRESVGYQRLQIRTILGNRRSTNKVSRLRYFVELRRSWAVLSPFGWGEITCKDYEVFLTGGLVIKPFLDHLETWPNLFERNVSYVGFSWDLHDLHTILEEVTENRTPFLQIAQEGQARYCDAIYGANAGNTFVHHLQQAWGLINQDTPNPNIT